jgi:hypothetical protein
VIVELAVALPVLLAVALLPIATGYFAVSQLRYQEAAHILAESAAGGIDESWAALVEAEDRRVGCHADPRLPEISYPEPNPGSRVLVVWRCHLTASWPFPLSLPVTVSAEAVVR